MWAQSKDLIFLTINVPNVKAADAQIKVQDDGSLYFKGVGGSCGDEHSYELDIRLLLPVKASVSALASREEGGERQKVDCGVARKCGGVLTKGERISWRSRVRSAMLEQEASNSRFQRRRVDPTGIGC